jgi:hypothetical protein
MTWTQLILSATIWAPTQTMEVRITAWDSLPTCQKAASDFLRTYNTPDAIITYTITCIPSTCVPPNLKPRDRLVPDGIKDNFRERAR